MNKSIIYIIILISLLIIIAYFYNSNSSAVIQESNLKTRHSKQYSTQFNKKTEQKKSINKVKKTDIITDASVILDDSTNSDEKGKKEDKQLDYINAFRNWNYFENCFTDIEDFHNKKDPLDTLEERFINNPRESQTKPTAQQNIYYQHHVDICKALIDDDEDDYYQVRQKLHEIFKEIPPKTDEEKQLEHAIFMAKQLRQFHQNYGSSQFSKSTLPQSELDALNTKMRELSTQLMLVYDENEELTEEHVALIEDYSDQIEVINQKIAHSRKPDDEKTNQVQAQIDGYKNSIDDYLHRVTSPDAFLLLAKIIYRIDYYQKDSSLIKNLKHISGIKDPYYINMLNVIVLPLVACSMNYPCDPDSDFMLSYCLGLRDSMFNQACGKNLEDFYFAFYIGANQLNDVNTYFNFLVNRYAH